MMTRVQRPNFKFEDMASGPCFGLDEVGRGPLAGPVVAACVYIPPEKRKHPVWKDVRDSKQLTAVRRDVLFSVITTQCTYGIAEASVEEIDTHNILQATFIAMRRAIAMCNMEPDLLLIDGNYTPKTDWHWRSQTIVEGDAKSVSIAAASILAKVTRDRMMEKLAVDYPHYNWHSNAGYGTPDHLAALTSHGPTPHHRTSFAPVREVMLRKTA